MTYSPSIWLKPFSLSCAEANLPYFNRGTTYYLQQADGKPNVNEKEKEELKHMSDECYNTFVLDAQLKKDQES